MNNRMNHINRLDTYTTKTKTIRRHSFYKRVIFSVVFIVTLITILFSLSALSSRAASTVTKEKHYESVRIDDGDTLTTLSDRYRDDEEQTYDEFMSDVCSVNGLSDPDIIHEDCYILVPVYSIR